MKPTIGRIVMYNMTQDDKNKINGNKMDVLPAVIVAVWGETCVNLKVISDGLNDLWLTSKQVCETPTPGFWNWPVKEN